MIRINARFPLRRYWFFMPVCLSVGLLLTSCGGGGASVGDSSSAGSVYPAVLPNRAPPSTGFPNRPSAVGADSQAMPTVAATMTPAAVPVQLNYVLPIQATTSAVSSRSVMSASVTRHLQYISSLNTLLIVTVTPVGGSPSTAPTTQCTPISCTSSFTATPGANTLTFTLGTGAYTGGSSTITNVLSTFSTTIIVQPSTLNTLNFTANPVVNSVSLGLLSSSVNAGTATNDLLTITAKDAAGRTIVGNNNYVDANGNQIALSLHATNAQAGGKGTVAIQGPLRITAPGQAAIYAHYDGNWLDYTDISVTTSGGTVAGAVTGTTLTTIPAAIEYAWLSAGFGPNEIVTGPDGNLWVTSGSKRRIAKVTTKGIETEFSTGITAAAPGFVSGITPGPDGNIWFTEFNSSKVGRITTSGTVTEFSSGISSTYVQDIVTGPDGNLWFDENGSDGIGRITTTGIVTEFSSGITNGTGPGGICLGPDSNIWFTDSDASKIGRMTTSGQGTEFAYADSAPIGASGFGCTTGPDGNIWLISASFTKILKATVSGSITAYSAGLGGSPMLAYIVSGPDGNLWFTDNQGRIGRITTAGTISEYTTGLLGGATPYRITLGSDGNLWFTDDGNNRIGKFVL